LKSLQNSADTPLRNRITIGGSIAFAPPWSDIIGALIVLDTKIILYRKNEGVSQLKNNLKNNKLKQDSLIAGIRFNLYKMENF